MMSTNAPVYPYISKQEADEKIKQILEDEFDRPKWHQSSFIVHNVKVKTADKEKYEEVRKKEYAKVDPALFRGN